MTEKNAAKPNKIMAFDFGMKRIGVAIGQTVTQSAQPLQTIPAKAGIPDWPLLDKLIKKWLPDLLLVGIPLNMDGTPQPITESATLFAESLHARYDLPIEKMDERLTTKDARERLFQQGGYKALQSGIVDQIAAQLILQNWFAEKLTK